MYTSTQGDITIYPRKVVALLKEQATFTKALLDVDEVPQFVAQTTIDCGNESMLM